MGGVGVGMDHMSYGLQQNTIEAQLLGILAGVISLHVMHNLTWFKGSEYTTHSRKAAVLCMWHVRVDMCGGYVLVPPSMFVCCLRSVTCCKVTLGGRGRGLMCLGLPS